MPYQNDDATLASVIGPAYVAQQAGIQNDNANQQAQIQTQLDQATMPAKIQAAGLENLFKGAQTNQMNAATQGLNLKNQETAGTLGSTIAKTNSSNQLTMDANKIARIGQLGNLAGTVAGYMDNVPPAARPAAMQQLLQQNGIDPAMLGPLANGDPDQLRSFSQKAIQSSADYQTKYMQEGAATDRSLGVAQIGSEGRQAAAQLQAGARVQAAQIAQQTKQMSQSFEQAAVAAEKAGDHAGAQRYYQAAQNIRQLSAQTTQQLVGVTPVSPGFDTDGGSAPSAPFAQPQQQQQAQPTPQGTTVVGDMEYRQLPDGSWQSRKVQK
jgi:hypothetical protein